MSCTTCKLSRMHCVDTSPKVVYTPQPGYYHFPTGTPFSNKSFRIPSPPTTSPPASPFQGKVGFTSSQMNLLLNHLQLRVSAFPQEGLPQFSSSLVLWTLVCLPLPFESLIFRKVSMKRKFPGTWYHQSVHEESSPSINALLTTSSGIS